MSDRMGPRAKHHRWRVRYACWAEGRGKAESEAWLHRRWPDWSGKRLWRGGCDEDWMVRLAWTGQAAAANLRLYVMDGTPFGVLLWIWDCMWGLGEGPQGILPALMEGGRHSRDRSSATLLEVWNACIIWFSSASAGSICWGVISSLSWTTREGYHNSEGFNEN